MHTRYLGGKLLFVEKFSFRECDLRKTKFITPNRHDKSTTSASGNLIQFFPVFIGKTVFEALRQ